MVFPQDAPGVLKCANQSVLVGVVHGTQLNNPIQAGAGQFVPLGERFLHPFDRRMTSVLHLDPVWRPSAAVRPILVLRDQALEPELAGLPEQVGADLALLEVGNKDALWPPCQKPGEIILPQVQRQLPQILALERQDCRRRRAGPRRHASGSAGR